MCALEMYALKMCIKLSSIGEQLLHRIEIDIIEFLDNGFFVFGKRERSVIKTRKRNLEETHIVEVFSVQRNLNTVDFTCVMWKIELQTIFDSGEILSTCESDKTLAAKLNEDGFCNLHVSHFYYLFLSLVFILITLYDIL